MVFRLKNHARLLACKLGKYFKILPVPLLPGWVILIVGDPFEKNLPGVRC